MVKNNYTSSKIKLVYVATCPLTDSISEPLIAKEFIERNNSRKHIFGKILIV